MVPQSLPEARIHPVIPRARRNAGHLGITVLTSTIVGSQERGPGPQGERSGVPCYAGRACGLAGSLRAAQRDAALVDLMQLSYCI
jgi:hypothetical protein